MCYFHCRSSNVRILFQLVYSDKGVCRPKDISKASKLTSLLHTSSCFITSSWRMYTDVSGSVSTLDQGVSVQGTSFHTQHRPQHRPPSTQTPPLPRVFPHLGHTMVGYPHHQSISVLPNIDTWFVPLPDMGIYLSATITYALQSLEPVRFKLNVEKSPEPVPWCLTSPCFSQM